MYKLIILLFFNLSSTQLLAQELKLHAEVAGNPSKPIIFFIHGSPGSAQNFSKFYQDDELKQAALLVAIDRPGYGTSSPTKKSLNVEEQAKLFIRYLEEIYPGREIILVGHSYGAVVAAKMASLDSNKFKSAILLSVVANPDAVKGDKKIKFLKMLSGITNSALCSSLIPNSMRTCQGELLNLENDVRSLRKDWRKIDSNVVFVYGKNDQTTPPTNAEFAKLKMGKNSAQTHLIENAGHQILDDHAGVIKTTLLKEVVRVKKSNSCSLYSLFSS